MAFFLSLNIFRGIGYAINGAVTEPIMEMMLISAPILAITLWYSNHFHFKVPDEHFKRVVAWVILFGGVSLFFAQAS